MATFINVHGTYALKFKLYGKDSHSATNASELELSRTEDPCNHGRALSVTENRASYHVGAAVPCFRVPIETVEFQLEF